MSINKLRKKKVFVALILLSISLTLASIILQIKEKEVIDTIDTAVGIFGYSTNLNTPFLYYEVRVETGEKTDFYEILLNSSSLIPSYWGVEVTVYDDKSEEIEGNRINNILTYQCSTRNMTFIVYHDSYLLVSFAIEVEAFYYEASTIILYMLLSLIFIWINYLTYVLIKRRKETEKWFKPFRK
ncbi:MAG: hypothetical protein H7645_08600 [Candidatus Heimdallarchaeota archaeon]|nr:hypothetical protein [Candidatus Heimdallarchaeota archaeon]MCK4770383.1 hypothetical protein [Candidatus Heimdallarchaeota archaeon]